MGEAGLCGLYIPEEYGGQGLSQTGYCRVSEVFAQIDPTLSVIMGVHQSIGMKPIALYGSDEQKARFLPDLASRPQARRVRADRAERRLRRERHRDDRHPAVRRLVRPQRREALHRQRLEGLGALDVREDRGRPTTSSRWSSRATWRGSRSATATTRWACARTTCGTCTSTASGSRRRTCSASRGTASRSPCTRSTTGACRWGRAPWAARRSCSTRSSTTSRSGGSSACRWPSSSSSRTRSAGWSPTCSGSRRWRT